MLSAILACCGGQTPDSRAEARPALAAQIKAVGASLDLVGIVEAPRGPDVWLIARPYELESQWSRLKLDLPAADRERLFGVNAAIENVLVARIDGDRVRGVTTLGPEFDVEPAVIVLRAGGALELRRREGERPIVIVGAPLKEQ